MNKSLDQLETLGRQHWPTLFSPRQLRGRTVRNRIVSTTHLTGWGHDGLLTPAEVDYHVRKAEGGRRTGHAARLRSRRPPCVSG